MVAYNKFNQFTKDLIDGVYDFDAHAFKVLLTLTAPVATNSVKADLTEIAAGNGYSAGGTPTTITTSTATGVAKGTATDVTFMASGGSIANFRYIVVYDDTPTSPADPLICWFDNGSTVTLTDGNSFMVDFSAANGLFTVT
jgi:hypothetical protein